ncbi:MAG: 6-carboxytetrahydropterin synthase [Acidobacteriota bacterium]
MAHYLLRIVDRFEASHRLTSYKGAPEPVHGHSWRVEVVLRAEALDDEGMGFDFIEARAALSALIDRVDHSDLNATPPFDAISPTTEHIARWFCETLQADLPQVRVVEATVWEGPHASATYVADG